LRSKYYSVYKTISMKKRTFAVDIDGTLTENGGGRIHLDALEALRHLTNMGHDVIFVTGRSSVEGFLLSVFGGTTKISLIFSKILLHNPERIIWDSKWQFESKFNDEFESKFNDEFESNSAIAKFAIIESN